MSPLPTRMSDHWWWRPGVRLGRRLLVWHILLDEQPRARALVKECQNRLAGLGGLDFVPEPWLRMTTQIVGFGDEISEDEVAGMVDAVAERLGSLVPVRVELGKVWHHSEAVMLGIRPSRALGPVRAAIREAVDKTVRIHQLADAPEWTPHVSVAYSNGDGPAAPVIEALAEPPGPQPFTVRAVHLVSQERADRLYRWEVLSVVPLGGPAVC